MNVLLVHAHPEPQSFCSAMKNQTVQWFESQGHTVQVSDLHAMYWNPVADASDFAERSNPDYLVYALEQRHAQANNTLPADIAAEVAKVQWCDVLVLNFPLYWFSVPAILKGWIDRVFVSGIFYGGRRIYDQGGMVGKTALVTLTLGGREHMFGEHGIHGDMNTLLKPLLQGSLGYCGFTVMPPFAGYHVPYISPEARAEVLKAHGEFIARWNQHTPLQFPRMQHFDKELKPLQ